MVFSADGQIEESSLGQVDPWGMGFLESGEPALPTGMWDESRADDLLTMMRRVRTRGLTPAERTLMRRMVLSPAKKPTGDKAGELLAERARIVFELGEAAAAAELMGQLPESPRGLNAEEISTDLNLALGNNATACQPVRYAQPEGEYWAKLRAVCAALQGNHAGAELAIEMARSQGVSDPWLFSAVFAASGDVPDTPEARFDSGVHLAMTVASELATNKKVFRSPRPDIAAAMVGRDSLPAEFRVKAARTAGEAGLIDVKAQRAAYQTLVKDPDFKSSSSLDMAFATLADRSKSAPEKARAIALALRSGKGSAARFTSVAKVLMDDIRRLPRNSDTFSESLTFAEAALAAGDVKGAGRWTINLEREGGEALDAFEAAMIDASVILGGADTSPASVKYVTQKLLSEAKSAEQKTRAARMFALWTGFDIEVNSRARALIRENPDKSVKAISPEKAAAISAAGEAGAAGEVVLSIVEATNGNPSKLDAHTLGTFFDALTAVGLKDAARQLAIEATGYWSTR